MALEKLPIKMSTGFGLSMIDRAVKEFHATRCTRAELNNIRAYFTQHGGLRCIYCLNTEATRWDHLHPVSKGGDTVPGNLVPACTCCDDSKQDRDVENWIDGTSPGRPSSDQAKRIRQEIERYQTHFSYIPRSFEEKLTAAQITVYAAFQKELQSLREHLQTAGLLKVKK